MKGKYFFAIIFFLDYQLSGTRNLQNRFRVFGKLTIELIQ